MMYWLMLSRLLHAQSFTQKIHFSTQAVSKWYVVKQGFRPGIYRTWAETEPQVAGFKGAIHKSFPSREEAEAWMSKGVPAGAMKRQKCYAVVRGRKPGIYTEWGEVQRQILGYSNAVFQRFSCQGQAKAWLREMDQQLKQAKQQQTQRPKTEQTQPSKPGNLHEQQQQQPQLGAGQQEKEQPMSLQDQQQTKVQQQEDSLQTPRTCTVPPPTSVTVPGQAGKLVTVPLRQLASAQYRVNQYNWYRLECDGSHRSSTAPSAGGCGSVLVDLHTNEVVQVTMGITRPAGSSQETEYYAALDGARAAHTLGVRKLILQTDLEVLVKQVEREWKLRSPALQHVHAELLKSFSRFHEWRAQHVARELNRAADHLSQRALCLSDLLTSRLKPKERTELAQLLQTDIQTFFLKLEALPICKADDMSTNNKNNPTPVTRWADNHPLPGWLCQQLATAVAMKGLQTPRDVQGALSCSLSWKHMLAIKQCSV